MSPTGASLRWSMTRLAPHSSAPAVKSPSFDPYRRITVWLLTPASCATSSSVTSSNARAWNSSVAASRIRSPVARQAGGDDPVRLQPEPQPLAVLGREWVEAREIADPLQAVAHRVAVCVDRLGGRVHRAVLGEVGLQGSDQIGGVLLVVLH